LFYFIDEMFLDKMVSKWIPWKWPHCFSHSPNSCLLDSILFVESKRVPLLNAHLTYSMRQVEKNRACVLIWLGVCVSTYVSICNLNCGIALSWTHLICRHGIWHMWTCGLEFSFNIFTLLVAWLCQLGIRNGYKNHNTYRRG